MFSGEQHTLKKTGDCSLDVVPLFLSESLGDESHSILASHAISQRLLEKP